MPQHQYFDIQSENTRQIRANRFARLARGILARQRQYRVANAALIYHQRMNTPIRNRQSANVRDWFSHYSVNRRRGNRHRYGVRRATASRLRLTRSRF